MSSSNKGTRRNFIKTLSSNTIGLSLYSSVAISSCRADQIQSESNDYPLVLSTWNNQKANQAAWDMMQKGQKSIDAVESGARVPESDVEDMSVGYGGRPDRDGQVTLDACIMDHLGNYGAVTYLKHIMHPISVARKVMEETPHVMLSGEGALKFAIEQGFAKQNLLTEKALNEWKEWIKKAEYRPKANIERHDTIGILAIDADGDIAGACTTSGMAYKMAGRVGDSPIVGAGLYVDNEIGAATATGVGELVLKSVGSFLIVELMRQGYSPQKACEEAVMRIVRKQEFSELQVGYIAINKSGEVGGYAIQPGFLYALTREKGTEVIDCNSYIS